MESFPDSIDDVLAAYRAWAKLNRSTNIEDFLEDSEVPHSFHSMLRTHLAAVTKEVSKDGLTARSFNETDDLEFPLVDEKFQILKLIGEGGMGRVYEAFDAHSESRIAIKTFRAVTPKNLLRLKAEFRELVDIDHPNLVKLLELYEHDGSWHFTMELVDGVDVVSFVRKPRIGSLSTELSSLAPSERETNSPENKFNGSQRGTSNDDLEETIDLEDEVLFGPDFRKLRQSLLQLIDAIECLHQNGKLHRDIKPTNTLVDQTGRLKLLDFGLVQNLTNEFAQKKKSTSIVGTIPYMSPEQSQGKPLTTSSDWYSVGVLLYECITGRLPFVGTLTEQIERKQKGAWEPLNIEQPGVPSDLIQLCTDWLESNPSVRPGPDDARAILNAERMNLQASFSLPNRFEGRTEELTVLHRAYEKSTSSQFVVRLIVGESGIGKTALARRFFEDLEEEVLVIRGAAYDRESIPFNGLDSVVDEIVSIIAARSDLVASLAQVENLEYLATLFPIIRSLDIPGRNSIDLKISSGNESRKKAFRCLVEILKILRRYQPVVIHIDDAQWLDDDSLTCLQELSRFNDLPPAMLLLASTVQIESWVDWSNATIDFASIGIEPLDQTSIRRILRGASGAKKESSEERIAELVQASRGSPLLANIAATQLSKKKTESSWDFEHLIQEQTASLSDRSKTVLRIIAIYGAAIQWSHACTAAFDLDDDPHVYQELRARNLIRLDREESGVRFVDVYHTRFRQWIRDGISDGELMQLNHAVANTLESAKAHPGDIAKQLLATGQTRRAFHCFIEAAKQATEILAFSKAAEMFNAASDISDGQERLDLMKCRADALAKAGQAKECADLLIDIAAHTSGNARRDLVRKAATQFLSCGEIDRGLSAYRDIGRKVEMNKPQVAAMLFGNRWAATWRRWSFRATNDSIKNDRVQRSVDTDWETALGLGLVDPILSACYQARCLNGAYRLNDQFRIARALPIEAAQVAVAGRKASRLAESYLQEARKLNRSLESPYLSGVLEFGDAVSEFLRGRWRNAITRADEAERIFRDECVGAWLELDNVRKIPLSALSWLGECEQLGKRLDALNHEGAKRGNLGLLTNPNSSALALLAKDEPDVAKNKIDQRLKEWSRGSLDIQRLLAIHGYTVIDLYLGKNESAWARIQKYWKSVSNSLFMNVQLLRGMMHMCRASAAIASLDSPRNKLSRHAINSVKALEKEDAEWAQALGSMLRASFELTNDTPDAVAKLETAVSLLEKSEVLLHANAAKWHLGRLVGNSRLSDEALEWMMTKGIRQPDKIAQTLCPISI